MRYVVMGIALLVGACGDPEVSGNAVGGVMHGATEATGYRVAQAHCQQYGKNARITQIVVIGGSVVFDCVKS